MGKKSSPCHPWDKRMIAEISPGKKGGDFNFPFGGGITVPGGMFNKKDVVTCCQVSPSDRHKYQPPTGAEERLISEVFLLATSTKYLKKSVTLRLPVYPEDLDLFEIKLLAKRTGTEEWGSKPSTTLEKDNLVEFEADGPGIYTFVSAPRKERFDIPVSGCLYNARINKLITMRVPKKAVEMDMFCDIHIVPLNHQNMPNLRTDYPQDMAHLATASDMFEFRLSEQWAFKRPVTVKLPLPDVDQENIPTNDIAVMQMTNDGWQVLDAPLKFTKSTVSFDTRLLSRYCVALAKPDKKLRLKDTFKHIERENNVLRGEILPFIFIQEKEWTLWFECVPLGKVDATITKREKDGFRSVGQSTLPLTILKASEDKTPSRKNWRTKSKLLDTSKSDKKDLDLVSGMAIELDIGGDLAVCEDDSSRNYLYLHFHEKLQENYRKFLVEPRPITAQSIVTGMMKCFIQEEGEDRRCIRAFDFDMDRESVAAYLYVEPEPQPEPEPAPKEPEIIEEKPETPPAKVEPVPVAKRPQTASFVRLTTSTKPARQISKESKVLTGRSLQCLAREIEQGLTLAIYLDISDSTITGMGFDALAKGLSLTDITYRILLLWKRRTSRMKDKQVDLLAAALIEMGREDAANVLKEQHRKNAELTSKSFEEPITAED